MTLYDRLALAKSANLERSHCGGIRPRTNLVESKACPANYNQDCGFLVLLSG